MAARLIKVLYCKMDQLDKYVIELILCFYKIGKFRVKGGGIMGRGNPYHFSDMLSFANINADTHFIWCNNVLDSLGSKGAS